MSSEKLKADQYIYLAAQQLRESGDNVGAAKLDQLSRFMRKNGTVPNYVSNGDNKAQELYLEPPTSAVFTISELVLNISNVFLEQTGKPLLENPNGYPPEYGITDEINQFLGRKYVYGLLSLAARELRIRDQWQVTKPSYGSIPYNPQQARQIIERLEGYLEKNDRRTIVMTNRGITKDILVRAKNTLLVPPVQANPTPSE